MTYVIKSTGEKERFNPNKIKQTIIEAGATKELAEEAVKNVTENKYNNIPTEKILDLTLNTLKKNKGVVARYDLKRAIMSLGPTGFPFERFFAMILKNYGYKVEVGQTLKGKHITHEVDVIAEKEHKFMIECKYHNKMGIKTRTKVPLYVYARFLDLKHHNFTHPWVATNTKCTTDSIEYARGVNMRITSWDYPEEFSIKKLIEEKKLYPITVLRSIGKDAKEILFEHHIYLIKTLVEHDIHELAKKTKFKMKYIERIIKEAKEILE